ncbi:hypothetical protein D1872_303360 [compost metagenome]
MSLGIPVISLIHPRGIGFPDSTTSILFLVVLLQRASNVSSSMGTSTPFFLASSNASSKLFMSGVSGVTMYATNFNPFLPVSLNILPCL